MKHRCHVVEVMRPGVDGGRPFDGCRDVRLLAEVEYAEPVGDEVQASEAEGLGRLKDGWNPHPGERECGKFHRAEENRIARARHGGGGGEMGHPITKKVLNVQCLSPQTAPTVGTESDQLVNICSFAVCYDRRWPST